MNLEKFIPDDYGQLENSDLPLSEGRISRIMREEMSEEQSLDGDAPHIINCVLSQLLREIIDETMDEAELMHKVKEAHVRSALRDLEIEEEYNARTQAFIDQLKDIGEQMERTAERLENKQ